MDHLKKWVIFDIYVCFFLSLVAKNMSMKTYNKIFSNCCRNRVAAELYKYCVVSFKCRGFISQTPDQIFLPIC